MKASTFLGAGGKDDSLEVLWEDTERVFCRLRREDAEGHKHAFISVFSGAEHPTLERVNRLTHGCTVISRDSRFRPCSTFEPEMVWQPLTSGQTYTYA
jgi:hypothetical protein